MDMDQLGIFVTLAESLNFTATAKKHYMTQPAISHQIQSLEKELGVKLLVRSSHHVALTSSGAEFLEYARQILYTAQIAKTHLYDINHGRTGHLRVLTVQGCSEFASRCLAHFHQLYPGILVNMDVVTGAGQMDAVEHNTADILITFSSLILNYPQMECRIMREDRYAILHAPGLLPAFDPNDLSALSEIPLVCELKLQAPFMTGNILNICRNRGLEPVNVHWCSSAMAHLLALRAGFGWGMTPTCQRACFIEGLEMIPLEGDDVKTDCAVGWQRQTTNQSVQFFLESLDEWDSAD